MGIPLSSQFSPSMQLPIDDRTVMANIAARDAIPAIERYEGLLVYIVADETNYQLQGGVTNADWVEITGGGGGGGSTTVVLGSCGCPPDVFGECNVPIPVTAGGGLHWDQGNMSPASEDQVVFIEGTGGPTDIARIPQIQAHTLLGAEMIIVGKSDTDTVIFEDGDGLHLNGPAELGLNDILVLMWRGDGWVELRRNT